jgi:transcriptional regulator with XRE-family HTH domain
MQEGTDTLVDMDESSKRFMAKLQHAIKRYPGLQRELAQKVGISPQRLSTYVNGTFPKPAVVYRLAHVLNLPLDWLMNEDEEDLEPPTRDYASGSLEECETTEIIDELSRRYADVVNPFLAMLHAVEIGSGNWQLSAAGILSHCQSPTAKLPEKLDHVLSYVDALQSTAMAILHYSVKVGSHADRRLPSHLLSLAQGSPGDVYDYWSGCLTKNPGLDALVEMSRYYGLPDNDSRKVRWMQYRAPYLMARLLTHPDVANESRFDTHRAGLKELGYLDADGNPVMHEEASYPPIGGVPLHMAREDAKRKAQFRKADDAR